MPELTTTGEYTLGIDLVLTVTITQAGAPVDPSEVEFKWELDDGATTVETYTGGAGNVVKAAVGVYTYTLALAADGRYDYRWVTTSPNGARESYFVVPASRMTTP